MKKKYIRIIFITLILSGCINFFLIQQNNYVVSASDIIVDVNGNGDYTSIQDAIDNAINGDTIYVWGGTYSEATFINVNKSINIIGNSSTNTSIERVYKDTSASDVDGIYFDNDYVFISDYYRIRAYSFNNISLTPLNNIQVSSIKKLNGDGTYLYVARWDLGISAYFFNKTTYEFSLITTKDDGSGYFDVWVEGSYPSSTIYAISSNKIYAYTFNGASFTLKDSETSSGEYTDIWGDGTYIYVAGGSGNTDVYTFNGASFTLVKRQTIEAYSIWGDGNYIYTTFVPYSGTPGHACAYDFDGSSFTLLDTYPCQYNCGHAIWGDENYIYITDWCDLGGTPHVFSLSFNGTSFTKKGTLTTSYTPYWALKEHNGFLFGDMNNNYLMGYGNLCYFNFVGDNIFNINANNVNISGFHITNASETNEAGVLINTSYVNISNYNISNCYYGINTEYSNNITIYENNIHDCSKYGVYFNNCENVTIQKNNITNNNGDAGIKLYSSSNNIIYNNYFNNTVNAIESSGTNNFWNITKTSGTNIIGGPYLGGNYWNNYTGIDTDGDGLGEWSYNFTINKDYLPLTYILPMFANLTAYPNPGYEISTYIFNITYEDPDDTEPPNIIKFVLIINNNECINTTPTWIIGDNQTGANYTYSTIINDIGLYKYKYVAYDGRGWNESITSYLWVQGSSGHFNAVVYINFYDANTNLGISRYNVKFYLSNDTTITASDRFYSDVFHSYTGYTFYYRVNDLFNNKIYPTTGTYASFTVDDIYDYINIPISWYDLSIANLNESIVTTSIKNETNYYNTTLFPYNTLRLKVVSGEYNITNNYYYPSNYTFIKTVQYNLSLTSNTYQCIAGYGLNDIVNLIYGINVNLSVENLSIDIESILENMTYILEGVNFTNVTINDMINVTIANMTNVVFEMWGSQNASFLNLENRSTIIFNIYNTNIGLGLDRETLQIYVNNSRLINNIYYCDSGNTSINLTVKDYYNFTLYTGIINITSPFTFIDLGLTYHSWLFGNKNDIYYMISLLKENASRWWERGIVPHGEREFLIPSGNYTLRIYDNTYTMLYEANHTVNNSRVYVIEGTNLSQIISGLSVITGQLLELAGTLDYALMPDLVEVVYSIPSVYSVFDRIGSVLGTKLICPALFVIAKTINISDVNSTVSYPLIPTNSINNGTITVRTDRMYFEGNHSNVNWVYVSYGSVTNNYSYLPSFIDLFGENVTISCNTNITIKRETIYQQITKFYWTKNTFTNYYTTTVNVRNPFSSTNITEVYVYVEFANDTTPDYVTTRCYDVSNGVYMTRGENFDVTASGIHFYLTSIPFSTNRSFTCSYTGSTGVIVSSDAIVSVENYNLQRFNNKNYWHITAQYINKESVSFVGNLIVKFNFTTDTPVIPYSFIVYDNDKSQYLGDDEFAPLGSGGVSIKQSIVGSVNPNGARTFDVYWLTETASTTGEPENTVRNLLSMNIFYGIQFFYIVCVIMGIVCMIIIFGAWKKKKSFENWKVNAWLAFLVIFVLFVFWIWFHSV